MRIAATALLIFAALIQLILGTLYVLGSQYKREQARFEAGDLSSVAGDLASPEELQKQATRAEEKTRGVGQRDLWLGIGCFVVEALLISSLVLILRRRTNRRTRGFTLGAALVLSLALTGAGATWGDGTLKLGALSCGAVLIALAYALMRQRQRQRQVSLDAR